MSSLEDDLKLEAAQEAFERLAAGVGSTLELPGSDVLSVMIFVMANLAARVTPAEQRAALHTFLGDFLLEATGGKNNHEAAIAEYRQAIAISCYSWAHNNLGLIWEKQGKIQDAISEFELARSCEPKDPAFEKNLQHSQMQQEASAMTLGVANR